MKLESNKIEAPEFSIKADKSVQMTLRIPNHLHVFLSKKSGKGASIQSVIIQLIEYWYNFESYRKENR